MYCHTGGPAGCHTDRGPVPFTPESFGSGKEYRECSRAGRCKNTSGLWQKTTADRA